MQIEIDEFIPETLYRVIAEILIWAYETDARMSSRGQMLKQTPE